MNRQIPVYIYPQNSLFEGGGVIIIIIVNNKYVLETGYSIPLHLSGLVMYETVDVVSMEGDCSVGVISCAHSSIS